MPKRTHFEDYRDKYENFRFEKTDDKILLFQMHTNGEDIYWEWNAHHAFGDACADVAGDRDVNVVIFTGSGDTFMDRYGASDPEARHPAHSDLGAEQFDEHGWYGRQRHFNFLDIQVPVIAAVNGPCSIHSELPVMCDIVLASDDAFLQDSAHFARGLVPGDGVHTVWPMVMGRIRAHYFLLTGQRLSAQEAQEIGVVNEVLPKHRLMDRAWELARYLAMRPPLTLRYTRAVFVQDLKRAATNDFTFGQMQELYAMRQFFPYRGGNQPLDRAWDDDPWPHEDS